MVRSLNREQQIELPRNSNGGTCLICELRKIRGLLLMPSAMEYIQPWPKEGPR